MSLYYVVGLLGSCAGSYAGPHYLKDAQRYIKLWRLKQVIWHWSLIHISQCSALSAKYFICPLDKGIEVL